MVRVENGAEGIQWGKLFQVLNGLGIRVLADVPDAASPLIATERDNSANARPAAGSVRPW